MRRRHAFKANCLCHRRKCPRHFVFDQSGCGQSIFLFVWNARRLQVCARGFVPRAEAAQIVVDGFAVFADRCFKLVLRQWQSTTAGNGTEHDCVDDRPALLCERIQIDEQCFFRMLFNDLDQLFRIEAAIAHGDLLVHGKEAAGGADHMCTCGRDEAVCHRTAGFQ